jgi:glycosyltransferase involved in cell wall biosynthesis
VKSRKYSVAEQFELRRRAREDRLDVFHSPFFVSPLSLTCPLVVTFHDLIPFLFRIYPWPKQLLVKAGYRAAARQARHTIAVSHNTAQDAQRLLQVSPDRVSCVYNSIDHGCFCPKGDEHELEDLERRYHVRPPYVVAASARNWRTKNLETAMEAVSQAHRSTGVDFQAVVYGPTDGIEGLDVKNRWPNLNLRQTGYIPAGDLAILFRHARAFIMPSLYEGFGLPIVEAMACGCPVITSNGGSLPEIAGDGAQVFAPFDAKRMAAAIAGLIENQENFEHWRAAALRCAADFTWERAAQQTISVYHRIHDQLSSAAGA